jgi:hypothetical protein
MNGDKLQRDKQQIKWVNKREKLDPTRWLHMLLPEKEAFSML